MTDFSLARTHMVQSQLSTNGVMDPDILAAFGAVPREYFVPPALRPFCYTDKELDLGQGRYLLEPMVLAKMIEALAPGADEHILTVGGAAGYGAAIVAQMAWRVTDLESDTRFDELYKTAMGRLGYSNVTRVVGDLRQGVRTEGGYDGILVQGVVPEPPYALAHLLQLGGRLVGLVVPEGARMGRAIVMNRSETGYVSVRTLFDVFAPYLPGCAPLPRFSFA